MLALLFLILLVPYRAPTYCQPDNRIPATYCGSGANPGGHPCLFYHPKEEFCKDENALIPSCCRAVDEYRKGNKGWGCACCADVHGSKHSFIQILERGWYSHFQPPIQEQEYQLK
jgi:hypothetical protein